MYATSYNIKIALCLDQGLPFHSTIVQREFTHIAYALLFSRRSDCGEHKCQWMV